MKHLLGIRNAKWRICKLDLWRVVKVADGFKLEHIKTLKESPKVNSLRALAASMCAFWPERYVNWTVITLTDDELHRRCLGHYDKVLLAQAHDLPFGFDTPEFVLDDALEELLGDVYDLA